MQPLKRLESFSGPNGPVVLCIMDGVGIGHGDAGDMVSKASTPNLDWLKENSLYTTLKAHGRAVGMPDDGDMGNSEVCLLYTSPSPRDQRGSRMPSSA